MQFSGLYVGDGPIGKFQTNNFWGALLKACNAQTMLEIGFEPYLFRELLP
jgi:hypothetical protein